MKSATKLKGFGWRIYGLGVMAIGLLGLALGDFVSGQTVPKGFPHRSMLAYAVGAFLVLAGAAVEWRRTTAWGAAALSLYYWLIVVLLMNGRVILRNHTVFGAYSGAAEQIAIAAAALIVYAASARIGAGLAASLTRLGQVAMGICALLFGGAHFVYMNLTAPLVPKWLPPTQLFWGYATGICFIAAGLALLTEVKARLAAILLTAMILLFAVLIPTPLLMKDHSRFNWTESVVNLAIAGAAWVVADSVGRAKGRR
ncbi:MAG: hypothetical protein M3O31_00145 [Acidobacteriota bacterium]|nr:hypothetical protein [Acidobacteriota bacterium]